jgi:tRNA1Val (adenine37-N6)-methyltransferase
MANTYFQFKQFIIHQEQCAMKVTTDACLFGSIVSKNIRDKGQLKILDIGTGTGLLALMLAQNNTHITIDAVEVDPAACNQAASNVALSPWRNNINIIAADVRSFQLQSAYDIIITNPPFYENELKGNNEKKNTAHHSQLLTLPALLEVIKNNLSSNGQFFILLPYKRHVEFKKLIMNSGLHIKQITGIKQTTRHTYFRFIATGNSGNNELKINFNEITIRENQSAYTKEFKNLLRDYYLEL